MLLYIIQIFKRFTRWVHQKAGRIRNMAKGNNTRINCTAAESQNHPVVPPAAAVLQNQPVVIGGSGVAEPASGGDGGVAKPASGACDGGVAESPKPHRCSNGISIFPPYSWAIG